MHIPFKCFFFFLKTNNHKIYLYTFKGKEYFEIFYIQVLCIYVLYNLK